MTDPLTRITEESTQVELFPDNGIMEGPKVSPTTTSTTDFGSTKSSVKNFGDNKDDKSQKCQPVCDSKDDKIQRCPIVGGSKDNKIQSCQTVGDSKDDKNQKCQHVGDSKDVKSIKSHSVDDTKDDKIQKCHTVVNIGRLTIPGIIPEHDIESDANEEVEPEETETDKENVNPTNGENLLKTQKDKNVENLSEYFRTALRGEIDSGEDVRSSTPINGGLLEIKTGSTMMASGE